MSRQSQFIGRAVNGHLCEFFERFVVVGKVAGAGNTLVITQRGAKNGKSMELLLAAMLELENKSAKARAKR